MEHKAKRAIAILSLTAAISEVHALDLTATLFSDVEYSDNFGLVSTNTKDDVVQSLGLDLGMLETRKNFQIDADFLLEGEHYYNNSYSDQTSLTTGIGFFNFDLI